MTAAKPGVLRRRREEVPPTLTTPISIFRPPSPDRGQFVVDAVHVAYREVDDQRSTRRRRRRGGR